MAHDCNKYCKKHTKFVYFNFFDISDMEYRIVNAALRNKRECDIVDTILEKGRPDDAEENLHCLYRRYWL